MFEFDTPFCKQVRSLKAPNSSAFDLAEWEHLLENAQPTHADSGLFMVAVWLAIQAKYLRELLAQAPIPALNARLSTILAVAMLNREYFVVNGKLQNAQKAAHNSGTLAVHQLANLSVGRGDGLSDVDVGSHIDAMTDAMDSWLFEAADFVGGLSSVDDLADVAVKNAQRFSLQRGHYDLWQAALWEGWCLAMDGQTLSFVPPNRELEALLDACGLRKEENIMENAWIDLAAWLQLEVQRRRELQLPLTVIAIDEKPGKRRRFVVGRPSATARNAPAYLIGKASLEGSYLAAFLERPLPAQTELNCELLSRAWYVLHDLASVLAIKRPRPTLSDHDNVRRWAFVVRRSELMDVLCRALSIGDELAREIVAFLSWSKGTYKGLWGAPLVPLPGTGNDLALAHSVLVTSNILRRTEIWLTKGGLDDNLGRASRGTSYEEQLRREIREGVKQNSIVVDSACAEHAIKKTASFPEQIDLVVQFASLLLVGEVKCLLFPADPRERYNFLKKLKDAAEQAKRKAKALACRTDIAARVLGIPESKVKELRVLPIVVMNQGFGMSLAFDDCVVTDAKFLKLYLSSGRYLSEAAFSRVDGKWADAQSYLYHNTVEATDNFERSMRTPPPLYRFVDQLRWTTFRFPTLPDGALQIARTELTDLSSQARSRYEALRAAVES
jgi:hypothetical protein